MDEIIFCLRSVFLFFKKEGEEEEEKKKKRGRKGKRRRRRRWGKNKKPLRLRGRKTHVLKPPNE